MIPLKINKVCQLITSIEAYSADERMTQALVSLDIANRVHILIFRKLYDQECNQIVYQIIQQTYDLNHRFVQDRQCLIYLEEQNIKQIQELDEEFKKLQSSKLKIFEQKIHETKIDLIITIGGDGTILYQQIQTIKSRISPPIIAFEKGTLGFLCIFPVNLHQEILSGVLDNIARKDNIVVEAKIRLQGTLNQENGQLHEYHVLNEFVVSRGMNPHCLKMEIYINDLLLTVSIGDGLIIATPTGSTAYSLSAGGSIIQNEVGSIQISPICPLSLSFRPVVLPSCMKIKLKLAKDCRGGGVITADGQKNYDFNQGDEFNIQLSPHSVQMSCLTKDATYSDWVAKLRQMLNWNQQFKEHRIFE